MAVSLFGSTGRINDGDNRDKSDQSPHDEDNCQVGNVEPDAGGKNSKAVDQSWSSLLGFYTINVMLNWIFCKKLKGFGFEWKLVCARILITQIGWDSLGEILNFLFSFSKVEFKASSLFRKNRDSYLFDEQMYWFDPR